MRLIRYMTLDFELMNIIFPSNDQHSMWQTGHTLWPWYQRLNIMPAQKSRLFLNSNLLSHLYTLLELPVLTTSSAPLVTTVNKAKRFLSRLNPLDCRPTPLHLYQLVPYLLCSPPQPSLSWLTSNKCTQILNYWFVFLFIPVF